MAPLFVVLSTVAAFQCSADDGSLRARFESEAPKQWAAFAAIANNLDIDFTEKHIRPLGETKLQTRVKMSGANALHWLTWIRDPTPRMSRAERVWCRNSSYAFDLSKKSPNDPWFVASVGADNGVERQLERNVRAAALFALRVFDRFLPDWYRSPEFVLKNVEWVERDSSKLVAVAFECAKPANEKTYWIRNGTVYLNPDRMWCIQECEYEGINARSDTERTVQKLIFKTGSGNLPLVRTATLEATFPNGTLTVQTDFERFDMRHIPDSEFTLSAFGLPEIFQPSPPWAQGWRWFVMVGVGIVCIIVAIALWWRSRSMTGTRAI